MLLTLSNNDIIIFSSDSIAFPAIISTLAALALILVIIGVLVAIAVRIKRKKSAILQANPVKSDASALYDIDLDKTDEHNM